MKDMRYAHILSFVLEHPWAITRPMLQTIAGILGRRAAGHAASDQDIAAALTNRKALPQPEGGGIAVIPVYGVLVPRANLMSQMSGGSSFDALTAMLREALGNTNVNTIVLDVDSPGGSVAGATEFAREVLRARTKKPIVAIANYTMASAAYWIASCATEIVASPSAAVGSVGVYTIHEDLSKALEMEGIKQTYISAGKYKTDGNESEPLSAAAEAFIQKRVDEAYALFCGDIARGRGVSVEDVRAGFGEGRTVSAQEAQRLGMVDKIATFDATIARLVSGAPSSRSAAAASADDDLAAATSATATPPPSSATVQEPAKVTTQERAREFDQQLQAVALLDL